MSDATEKAKGTLSGLQTAGIAAMAAIIGAVVSAWFPYLSRDRELDIRLVEIGVGILRADPQKSGVSAARQWAIVAIEENSGIEFTPEDRAVLLDRPLGYDLGLYDSGYSLGFVDTVGPGPSDVGGDRKTPDKPAARPR